MAELSKDAPKFYVDLDYITWNIASSRCIYLCGSLGCSPCRESSSSHCPPSTIMAEEKVQLRSVQKKEGLSYAQLSSSAAQQHSSDEDETYNPTITHTRLREFYRQGFEAGMEVASEEVGRLQVIVVIILSQSLLFLSFNGPELSPCINLDTRLVRQCIVAR